MSQDLATKLDFIQLQACLEVKIARAKTQGMRWILLVVIGEATLALACIMYVLLQNAR